METFAERLRYARDLRGLSQQELARACGLSQSAISSYESSNRKSPHKLLVLAQALKVNIYWLSRGQGNIEPDPEPARNFGENWPFVSIDPQRYKALSEKNRQVVEKTLAALIDSLSNQQ